MRSTHRYLLLLLVAVLALILLRSGVAGFPNRVDRVPADLMRSFAKLKPGMSPDQVREIVGPPKQIARQILYHRYREQWVYESTTPLRLTFDWPRGQLPQLLPLPKGRSEKDGELGGEKDR